MSSNQSKIMGQVTSTVRFIVEQTQTTMMEKLSNEDNDYNLSSEQIREIVQSLEVTVNSAYQRSMNEIIRVID